MRQAASIPTGLHTGLRTSVKEALGAFWSSVFHDQELIDSGLAARVLSTAQAHLDAMEALSLRDHNGLPVFHREHWHPLVISLSQRNTGRGLVIGMPDRAVIGPQTQASNPGHVYLENEIFEVGGNATYSKVHTYPFVAMEGCPLKTISTCLCDAVSSPRHTLQAGRDFSVEDGILVIRKEQDPFETDGYWIIEEEDDRLAVLWACDATFDTNNVSDFVGYPLGFDVASSEASARMLGALWDAVTFGLTPRYLNVVLGAVFDIPTIPQDTTVERVETEDGMSTVVTTDAVYKIPSAKLSSAVVPGTVLSAGDFLTNDIHVYRNLSKEEFSRKVDAGELISLSLPPGSISGVTTSVILESMSSTMESGGWFKLNSGDTGDSPFWQVVRARLSVAELQALFLRLADGGATVNPLKTLGYLVLANLVLVLTSRSLSDEPCAGKVFSALRRLMPDAASLLVVQTVTAEESVSCEETSCDFVTAQDTQETMAAASDRVTYTFVPDAATEV